jgi:7-carboxy-7-deazaguanine synthase
MVIAETFTSIQGEGLLAGVPSFFIRTSGCNLRCAWCDTPYTSWQPEGVRLTLRELLGRVADSGRHHIVITGGEPLLQRELGDLTRALVVNGHHITVETAGTLAPEFESHLLSVSPKTANSDPEGRFRERHRTLRSHLEPLRRLLERHPDHQLKFVVQGEGDLPEVLTIVESLGVERERVMLMAEGHTAEQVAERARSVGRLCLEHGFRYSPRLHLDLFGAGRGL